MIKLTKKELSDIILEASRNRDMPSNDVDEMAIPTYMHSNALIKWLFWRRLEYICELGRLDEVQQVLDFGCGIGVLLPTLCSKVKGEVHATDLYLHFAKNLTKQRNLDVKFHLSDLEFSGISDKSLDLIIAADSLEHIENVQEYLKVFRKKLKNNGRLIISGPTENIVYKLGRVIAGFGEKGHYHLTNVDHLTQTIQYNGFELVNYKKLPFEMPPYLFKVLEFVVKNN